ncbi:hypothetical protein RHOSPDRAFT_27337 [Rhodotorula sp. JG-1b]|nr:hypothetical protein RHOSPDRAFT_27337 [Rhodotorula sp. JG-1b]
MPRRSSASSSTATAAASPLSQQQQQPQPKGKVSFISDQGPVLRSSAWTSAAQLGSLFAPSSSSSKKPANEIDTDTASTLSSTSSFEFDQPAPAAADPSSSSLRPAAAAPPRRSGSSAYTFHTTPIPPGALVLLAEGKTTSPILFTSNNNYNGSMAPSRRNASSAAMPSPQQQQQQSGGGRQTKVWAGPKGKMPALQRWKVWYGGVSVIEMLETVRSWSSLRLPGFARAHVVLIRALSPALAQKMKQWETVLYHSIILVALFAVFCALAYLPAHVSTMVKRAQWYISGVDA